MLSGESVAGLTDDVGVAAPREVLPISDFVLRDAVEAMESAWAAVAAVESFTLEDCDRRALLVRMESLSRAIYGTSHTWLTELIDNDGLAVLPDRTDPSRLASLLRIDPGVAGKRIKIAAKIAPRRAMTGEPLEPQYPATAAAHRDGDIDAAHVKVIDAFFDAVPAAVDHESKVQSEVLLANLAKQVAPEQLRVAAARLLALLDPDGTLADDKDPQEKCHFTLGAQRADGLSKGSFLIDAEFRAYLEVHLAKLAKAGVLNPDEPHPVPDDLGPTGSAGDPTLFDSNSDDSNSDDSNPDDSDDESSSNSDDSNPDDSGNESGGNSGGSGNESGSRSGETGGTRDNRAGSDGTPGSATPGSATPGSATPQDESAGGAGSARESASSAAGSASSAAGSASGRSEGGDASPVGGMSDEQTRRAGRDTRSRGRRNHDAVKAVLRQMLASGALGEHRGLPVTAIITMTAKDLEEASGHAVTGTGSLVTIRDAIRMASHAHHYLAIFDNDGRALYLGRSKRLASADQRIVLIARDRGCTFPMCTRPATWCQAHHIDEWNDGGSTDIDSLTFGCDLHHPLVGDGPHMWATTTTGPDHPYPGRTQWHPPVDVDPARRGLINHYHHPQEYLYNPDEPDPDVPDPNEPEPDPDGT